MAAMGERTFTLVTDVPAAPDLALDFLADLARHRGMHPFLVSARVVDAGPGWQERQVQERPTLGPFRYPVRFRARLARPRAGELVTRVRLSSVVRLDSVTVATGTADGTRLVETTTVTAPWPMLGYVARSAERAHARTFALLPAALTPR